MASRLILRLAVLFAGAAALVDGAVGQSRRPPVPAPPVRDFVLCGARLENLFSTGVEERRDHEDRANAFDLLGALYQKERDRLTDQVEDELGPLAWSVFVPGDASAAQKRFDELRAGACVHSSLLRGRESADAEIQARSLQLLDRYDAPVNLPERFFMGGAVDSSDPSRDQAVTALRLELPPSQLVVPGGLITGRVVLDTGSSGAGGASTETLGDGLLAEVAGQTARVGRDGLFSLRAPEVAGTFTVEVRHVDRPLLVPVDGVLTIVRRGGAADGGTTAEGETTAADLPPRPSVACPGFDGFLDATLAGEAATPPAECWIVAPRVLLPEERLVVLGRLSAGSGRATRAFVGPWEAPLLAKTPIAAVFDVSAAPAGLHPISVYEGGTLTAVAVAHRVLLLASSDRAELGRGDMATFSVRVEGIPLPPPAPEPSSKLEPAAAAGVEASPLAFLEYVNKSPEVGRFRGQADGFTVAVARADLAPEPAPLRGEDQRLLIQIVEGLLGGVRANAAPQPGSQPAAGASATGGSGAAMAGAPSTSGSFNDVQRYSGVGDGDFRVQVSVRLPEEMSKLVPAIVPVSANDPKRAARESPPANTIGFPLADTGIDEHGVFAEIGGQRFYFAIGYSQPMVADADPAPIRRFDAACSGTCQCSIQSWDHAGDVGAQVAALDRSRPEWRAVTAGGEASACDEARAQCYGRLSLECRTRCKQYFEGSLTDHVSGFAVDAKIDACSG